MAGRFCRSKYVILDKKLFLAFPFMALGFAGNELYLGIRAANTLRIVSSICVIVACILPCWIFKSTNDDKPRLKKVLSIIAVVLHIGSTVATITELFLFVSHHDHDNGHLNLNTNSTLLNNANGTLPIAEADSSGSSGSVTQNATIEPNRNSDKKHELSSPLLLLSMSLAILINTFIGIHSKVSQVPSSPEDAATSNENEGSTTGSAGGVQNHEL